MQIILKCWITAIAKLFALRANVKTAPSRNLVLVTCRDSKWSYHHPLFNAPDVLVSIFTMTKLFLKIFSESSDHGDPVNLISAFFSRTNLKQPNFSVYLIISSYYKIQKVIIVFDYSKTLDTYRLIFSVSIYENLVFQILESLICGPCL